jgi:hypothetical protein
MDRAPGQQSSKAVTANGRWQGAATTPAALNRHLYSFSVGQQNPVRQSFVRHAADQRRTDGRAKKEVTGRDILHVSFLAGSNQDVKCGIGVRQAVDQWVCPYRNGHASALESKDGLQTLMDRWCPWFKHDGHGFVY